jgi:signal transduction histidine kinase
MQAPKVIRRSPVVFALALLAAVALLFISEGSYWQSVEILDDLGQMAAARVNIQRLERGVLDAETSQGGFLLTGRSEYLDPYGKALQAVEESFKQLGQHYGDAAQPREMLGRLRGLTDTRLSIIAETIRLYREGKTETAKELVLSGLGREKMEAIREVSAELLAYESLNVAKGRASVYQTLLISRISVTALCALMLLALYMYLRHVTTLEAHRQELKRVAEVERARLEVEVKQRTAQLTELTQHLLTAREDERHRLARDLHDELGALLTSAKLDAARIKSRLADTAPEAQERLVHLVGTLNSSIALGRRIIEDLRPSTLANLGLVAALEILAREFAERSGIEVQCTLTPVALSASAELVVYRLVQEAITNLSKHAKARRVWLSLTAGNGQMEVSVRDDGVGFDSATPPTSAYGLLGMRFRVEAEHGSLSVVSAPGQGTTVRVTLPQPA